MRARFRATSEDILTKWHKGRIWQLRCFSAIIVCYGRCDTQTKNEHRKPPYEHSVCNTRRRSRTHRIARSVRSPRHFRHPLFAAENGRSFGMSFARRASFGRLSHAGAVRGHSPSHQIFGETEIEHHDGGARRPVRHSHEKPRGEHSRSDASFAFL